MNPDRIPLLDSWKFSLLENGTDEEATAAVLPGFDDASWRTLTLPHDWQIEQERCEGKPDSGRQGYFPREHLGVYRLHLPWQDAWAGKAVRVLFDGVQHFASIYLNGRIVGSRPYGYLPILCDLTPHLRKADDNVLSVVVDNRDPSGGKWSAYGGDRWYSGAGIYRKVWLLVDNETRLVHDGIRISAVPVSRGPNGDVPDVAGIRCDRAKVCLTVEVEGCRAAACSLEVTVIEEATEKEAYRETIPCGNGALQNGILSLRHSCLLSKPLLWSPESPSLYRALFTLRDGRQVLDRQSIRFGVRSAVFDSEDGFVLNGEKVKLFGVNLHHDGGCVGAAVPEEVWKRRLDVQKGLGVNTIRCSHNPMDPVLYDLCDTMGFLVIDELYDKWCGSSMYFDAFYEDWHERDLHDFIRRDGNHPCVILWSVGNEVRGQYSELYFRCLRELCDQARQEDPTRPVSTALITFVLPDYNDTTPLGRRIDILKRYADIVDVVMLNYMENYYERLRAAGMRKPIIGSEVRTYYRGDDRFPDFTNIGPESPYDIVKRHDWVCGALVWAGVDYLGESPFFPLRGWTGNLLDSTADRKLRAWYCASHWKKEPVLKLAVYDESEPWDGARGFWGFPQMRAHWRYPDFEKMMHVAVMTNCDTVKLYQNSQTVRTGYLAEHKDGMIHFYLPYIPGVLRAEGYRAGHLAATDALFSDHEAAVLRVEADRTVLPADGQSVLFVDIFLEDAHGKRYMLEDRQVQWAVSGVPVTLLADNGNAYSLLPFTGDHMPLHNGHLMLLLRAGHTPGMVRLSIQAEGFAARELDITIQQPIKEE